jgi:hypothetical protein
MKTYKELVDLFRGVRTDEENIDELAPIKKRIDKSSDAKARRREAKLDYKKNKAKIGIERKKKRQKEKSSGVAKKREKMAAQGKTLGGERKTTRVS